MHFLNLKYYFFSLLRICKETVHIWISGKLALDFICTKLCILLKLFRESRKLICKSRRAAIPTVLMFYFSTSRTALPLTCPFLIPGLPVTLFHVVNIHITHFHAMLDHYQKNGHVPGYTVVPQLI